MSIRQMAALLVLVVVAFGAGSWYSSRSAAPSEPQVLYYQDPMHPAYRSEKPGVAPDCGMALVPVYAETRPARGTIRVDPEKQRLLGIRLAKVESGGGKRSFRTPGRVAVDTGRLFVVNAASDGYFKSLDVNPGDSVEKGQLLGSFFARELRPSALGHLATLDRLQVENSTDSERLRAERSNIALSVEILHNIGVSDAQIRQIEQTRQVPENVELRAPGGGVVVGRSASVGQRFGRGDELFRIADLTSVWILADLFPEDAGSLPRGATARVRFGNPARSFTAIVSDSVPGFDPVTQTVKIRFTVKNPGLVLKPDMFVDVEASVPMPAGLTVPQDAVLDAGNRKSVFLRAADGSFVQRTVATGWRSGARVQIVKGLEAGEEVVVSGQFLLDSETRMQAHP